MEIAIEERLTQLIKFPLTWFLENRSKNVNNLSQIGEFCKELVLAARVAERRGGIPEMEFEQDFVCIRCVL